MRSIFLLVVLFSVSSCGFKVVNTGQRGIKVRFGKVTGEPLEEGFYFFNPLTTSIKELSIREKKYEASTTCYSKDAQVIDVVYTVNYKPVTTEIHNIYKEVGHNWSSVLLKQILEGNIKEVTGMYTAVELIEQRRKATDQLVERLKEELALKRIELISFELSNMDFDDQFEMAVKNKVIAVEQAKEAKNKTVKVQEEARQRIIKAKAEAESMEIRTRALSRNKSLIEYEAVQKWDGRLPHYMMGGSATPFINLKTK